MAATLSSQSTVSRHALASCCPAGQGRAGGDPRLTLAQQLVESLEAVLSSRRWRLGDAIGSAAGRVSRDFGSLVAWAGFARLRRPGVRLLDASGRIGSSHGSRASDPSRMPCAAHSIRHVCARYMRWKAVVCGDTLPRPLPECEARQLDVWVEELDQAFQLLIQSRRWKLGNWLVNAARITPFRRGELQSINHIRALLQRYRALVQPAVRRPRAAHPLADRYYDLGHTLERAQRWGEAAEAYLEAMSLSPPRPGQHYRLARVRGHQGRWEEAAEAYAQAVRGNAGQPLWFYRLGHAREKNGAWADAARAYEKAVQLDPSKAAWFRRLGLAREKSLVQSPQYSRLLGLRVEAQGDWAAAAQAHAAAAALEPKQPRHYFRLAHVLEKMRDFDGAAASFEQAVRLDPTRPRWLFRLGRVREQRLDLAGALEAYQEVSARDPADSSARARAYAVHLKLAQWRESSRAALDADTYTEAATRASNVPLTNTPSERRAATPPCSAGAAASWLAATGAQPVRVAATTAPSQQAVTAASSCQATAIRARRPAVRERSLDDRLRDLLERADLSAARAEAEALLYQVPDQISRTDLMPPNWWLALHWRFLNLGWFPLAYAAKDIAATAMVARSAPLEVVGLGRYLDVAKALVQLGSRGAAARHLRPLVEGETGDEQARLAATKLAADLDTLTGDVSKLPSMLAVHDGVNVPEAEERFRQLIAGRSVAVVGPLGTGPENGAEIDAHDTVVRVNFVEDHLSPEQALRFGTRTDVSYINGLVARALQGEIRRAVERGQPRMVVLRPFSYAHGRQRICEPGDLRYNPSESGALLRARSFGIQRILHDVLRYAPRAITVFNVDFFLTAGNYKQQGYRASQLLADVDPFYLGYSHDYRGDFIFTKNLRDRALLRGDAVVERLLDLSVDDYLGQLEAHWA